MLPPNPMWVHAFLGYLEATNGVGWGAGSSICSHKKPVRHTIYTLSTLSNRKPAMTDSNMWAEITSTGCDGKGANGTWDCQVNTWILHWNTWGNKLFIIKSVLKSAIILHNVEPNEEKYAGESVINFCYKSFSFLTFDPRELTYMSQYY